MEWLREAISFTGIQTLSFVLGIGASLVAAVLYQLLQAVRKRRLYGSLLGTWVEINQLQDRPFSICHFYFSTTDLKLKFVGDNYDNECNIYYRWWSEVLHIDEQRRRITYFYQTERYAEVKKDEGFGCMSIHLSNSKQRWEVTKGYFLDIEEGHPRHTRMHRFEEVASHLNRTYDPDSQHDQQALIRELNSEWQKPDSAIRRRFGIGTKTSKEGD